MVERYLPHTSDDDDSRYRDPEEIEAAMARVAAQSKLPASGG